LCSEVIERMSVSRRVLAFKKAFDDFLLAFALLYDRCQETSDGSTDLALDLESRRSTTFRRRTS